MSEVKIWNKAKAGFFYGGHHNDIICFYCGKCLRNYDTREDPYNQHCQLYAACGYIKTHLGWEFIAGVLKEKISFDSVVLGNTINQVQCPEDPILGTVGTLRVDACTKVVPRVSLDVDIAAMNERRQRENSSTLSGNSNIFYYNDGSSNMCKVCDRNESRVKFHPCGHLITCKICTVFFQSCPLCYHPITSKEEFYLLFLE